VFAISFADPHSYPSRVGSIPLKVQTFRAHLPRTC
jgi:hypothetical protein